MDYEKNLLELIKRMDDNLKIFKINIERNLTNHIRFVSVTLEMLDKKHFQQENGVDGVVFSGRVSSISNDEIFIQPCICEANATLHNFIMRPDCFLVGTMSFIHSGKDYTLFDVKSYSINKIGTDSEFQIKATSNSDTNTTNTVDINIKLDSKRRICYVKVSNIKLSDFPSARSEFLDCMNGSMDMNHIVDVKSASDRLALEYAKHNVCPIKSEKDI